MKRGNDQSIREALAGLLHDYHLDEKVNEQRLRERWEKIFGKTIMKYTRKISVREKKLFLTLDSPSLRQDILFNKQKVIERINAEIAADMVAEMVLL